MTRRTQTILLWIAPGVLGALWAVSYAAYLNPNYSINYVGQMSAERFGWSWRWYGASEWRRNNVVLAPGTFVFTRPSIRPANFTLANWSWAGLGMARRHAGYVETYDPPRHDKMMVTQVRCPLWLPFLIAVIPSGFVWWRTRTFPPGHCQRCGYNLTGNVSGRCPECGEAA